MRVAMISYHTCPLAILGGKDTGGMNVYVRDLTRHLGPKGIKVDVFTRSQNEHVPYVLHDLGYGNRVVHVPAGPEVPLPKEELVEYISQFVGGIEQFAGQKNIHYDLVHSHYWMSGLAALEIKKQWGVPVAHMFHTLGVMKNRVAQSPEEKEGEYRLDGERLVISGVDRIVAATPAELAQLQWLYGVDQHHVTVIPPGVDISRFYPIPEDEAKAFIGVPPEDHMLLFVGRIEPLKGLDILLEAIGHYCKERKRGDRSRLFLAVIGGEPDADPENMTTEMARLQALREQYGITDVVTFLGKRSQDTLPYYYSAAEAVVVPSHYESFGMVALEAMACGTPVVASQVGGLAFLVKDGETGYTIPVGDPDALCGRLEALINDPVLRKTMGEKAAAFAQEYSWDKIAGRIIQLYQELLGGETPRNLVESI
jgi:D-inositol-3-phosphate glycosyltransferase